MVGIIHLLKIAKLGLPFIWSMIRSRGLSKTVRECWFTFATLLLVVILGGVVVWSAGADLRECANNTRAMTIQSTEINVLNDLLEKGP